MRLAPDWTPTRKPFSPTSTPTPSADSPAQTPGINPTGRLWDFIEQIAMSRREGKNRRDGATVSTRVLKLADRIGQKLFEVGEGKGDDDGDSLKAKKKRGERRKMMQAGRAHL